ncbi:hypothetical protein MRX96_039108 [Rhipicephalus microplus]
MRRDRINRALQSFKYDSVSDRSTSQVENCQHVASGDRSGNLEHHSERRHKEVYQKILADEVNSTKHLVLDEVEGCPAAKLRQVNIQEIFQSTSSKHVSQKKQRTVLRILALS